ncbi:uncharacterized protein PV09_02636 [Verruconis gallopava]|uniref:VPS9 domain-containing protein n=1 Tax=Verruconis gallopava TaxID=253628 RepID=A0A0D1XW63_9PEZI|nr:uncharacterized protein PV09_02636 [Verruconis gallopava]KIW06976.1 hypothetical protein PV09_02636 [Verruconis gallopava]
MQPLNPFLRAFFRSTLPTQCSPVQHYVLLVPSTELLLTSRDRETHVLYSDLATNEEFLASHVLRIPGGVAPSGAAKDGSANFRETRTKAKQFTTLNGRTVIIKDSFVYTNKGFKTLNQVQLLSDSLYFPDWIDANPWLVYSISKPLIGNVETIKILPAVPDEKLPTRSSSPLGPKRNGSTSAKKKDIKSFADLLNSFPLIARQMQPGLERLFKEFSKEFEKPLPALPAERSTSPLSTRRRSGSGSSTESRATSTHSSLANGHYVSELEISDEEEMMRRALETAVTAAIDMFQMVDKQQLSLLGSTTDLTGTMVERMIERYVTEQFHHQILFPRMCAIRKSDDQELEGRIRQMQDIDISQVGLSVNQDHHAKKELGIRLSKGVDVFKKIGVASSPQEMLEILLETEKAITKPVLEKRQTEPANGVGSDAADRDSEKTDDSMLTTSADTLVSLLLVVVIRAPVRYLNARLSYMRHFIFIDDVESGEAGYALSTFEAVLSYLVRDSVGIRRASRRNRRLWEASKAGNVAEMKRILEPDSNSDDGASMLFSPDPEIEQHMAQFRFPGPSSLSGTTINGDSSEAATGPRVQFAYEDIHASLEHVFPWQKLENAGNRPKVKKRVSLQSHSTSSSSAYSITSLPETIMSHTSGLEADTSIETLARTQGPDGDSVMMMAVEGGHDAAVRYLLSLEQYFPLERVIEDENNDGTTLLSAAIQGGHPRVIDTILDFIIDHTDDLDTLRDYIARQDKNGRCAAHYLFHYPRLIGRIGSLIPWKLKDKNGQTPLFALCRSYDHEEYTWMVDTALTAATAAQGDGKSLHLDDHVDNKGNTLLHIVNDPQMASKLLYQCDSDVNAANDKQFTPLMVASKYGRTDMVRTLFGDPRVDFHAKDLRGLTATELAKDDDVRNRIDDLVLLASPPGQGERITTVVRAYFVEDGTVRFIVKSGAQNPNSTITVTTSRRGLADFEDLARWLSLENPASWVPAIVNTHSPFLIPSKPSKAVARDMQLRFDTFLKTLLSHSTFATHEMVWEFFLVPDMDPAMLAERSRMKAETRAEMVKDEFDPITDVREVEVFIGHAKDSVRGVHHSTKSVLRRVNRLRLAQSDIYDASNLASTSLSTLAFLPEEHKLAFKRYVKTLAQPEFSPTAGFYYSMHAISTTITAVLAALTRPTDLIQKMNLAQKAIDRQNQSLRRSDRWPTSLSLLDETRARMQRDALDKLDAAQREKDDLGRELRYTQGVVAGELAAWQGERLKWGKNACKEFARRMIVLEKARLEGMRRALRIVGVEEGTRSSGRVFGAAARQARVERLKKIPLPPTADTTDL